DDHESAGGSGRFTRAGPTVSAVGDVWVRRKKLPARRAEAFASRQELLDGDAGAGRLELGLGLVGGFLGDLLQQRLGRAVDQVLGLLEAQAGDDLPDDLDDADLLVAGGLEDHVELRLLLCRL